MTKFTLHIIVFLIISCYFIKRSLQYKKINHNFATLNKLVKIIQPQSWLTSVATYYNNHIFLAAIIATTVNDMLHEHIDHNIQNVDIIYDQYSILVYIYVTKIDLQYQEEFEDVDDDIFDAFYNRITNSIFISLWSSKCNVQTIVKQINMSDDIVKPNDQQSVIRVYQKFTSLSTNIAPDLIREYPFVAFDDTYYLTIYLEYCINKILLGKINDSVLWIYWYKDNNKIININVLVDETATREYTNFLSNRFPNNYINQSKLRVFTCNNATQLTSFLDIEVLNLDGVKWLYVRKNADIANLRLLYKNVLISDSYKTSFYMAYQLQKFCIQNITYNMQYINVIYSSNTLTLYIYYKYFLNLNLTEFNTQIKNIISKIFPNGMNPFCNTQVLTVPLYLRRQFKMPGQNESIIYLYRAPKPLVSLQIQDAIISTILPPISINSNGLQYYYNYFIYQIALKYSWLNIIKGIIFSVKNKLIQTNNNNKIEDSQIHIYLIVASITIGSKHFIRNKDSLEWIQFQLYYFLTPKTRIEIVEQITIHDLHQNPNFFDESLFTWVYADPKVIKF